MMRGLSFRAVLACCATLCSMQMSLAAGFEKAMSSDARPLSLYIWYPSPAWPRPHDEGSYVQDVAVDAPIAPGSHRLVVISHGSSGSPLNHYDLAIALANAGFVVAAPVHPGDNYADNSAAGFVRDLADRPRDLQRTIDFMVDAWHDHAKVDHNKVGVFGFSLGGLAALTLAGGEIDLARFRDRCASAPASVECTFEEVTHGDQLAPQPHPITWTQDARIAAVVVAAPAVSLLFADLAGVKAPVQMWRAERDENVPDAYNTAHIRELLHSPLEEHVVPRAGHFVFQAPCGAALAKAASRICTDPPGVDRVELHRQFNPAVVAFFQKTLLRN